MKNRKWLLATLVLLVGAAGAAGSKPAAIPDDGERLMLKLVKHPGGRS